MVNSIQRNKRAGFTLVEMLVVIAIIGILAAILIPTLYNVVRNAKYTKIALELTHLKDSIEAYKQKFGDYPPDFSNPNLVVTHLRKIFPRHTDVMTNVSMKLPNGSLAANTSTNTPYDVYQLDPSEALVFWLAMLRNDPRKPFNGAGEAIRLFEFDEKRLMDVDGDGWLSYVPPDGRGAPYVYFDSRTYNYGFYADGTVPSSPRPRCRWPLFAWPTSNQAKAQPTDPNVGVVYPFQTDRPHPPPQTPADRYAPNMEWVNSTTYQIISASLDGEFGPDTYSSSGGTNKAFPSKSDIAPGVLNWAPADNDNIADFSDGKIFKDHLE